MVERSLSMREGVHQTLLSLTPADGVDMASELKLNMRSDGYLNVNDLLKLNLKTLDNILLRSNTIDDIREAVPPTESAPVQFHSVVSLLPTLPLVELVAPILHSNTGNRCTAIPLSTAFFS
ncbi:unnamed protein product [Vicia faba]|uniref:Uncharacterized protein n=1 Tax=Vicia faba TaxID=3906 RepID=A0AAV0Z5K9_VICFA|nr:unnamed protein product [Vicia faba]